MAKSKQPTADGQSLAYRDPSNFNTGTTRKGRPGQYTGEDAFIGGYNKNSNAYSWLNPVYSAAGGDYGKITDATEALEIKNIDEKKEARDIVAYLNNEADNDSQKDDKPSKKDKPKDEPSEELVVEQPADREMDPFIESKVDSVNEYAAALDDGRYFNYRDNDDMDFNMDQMAYQDYFDTDDSTDNLNIDSNDGDANTLLSKYIDKILEGNRYI